VAIAIRHLTAEEETVDLVPAHCSLVPELPITSAAAAALFRPFGFSPPDNRGTPHDFQVRR